MADGLNGRECAKFTIGGEDIYVPAFNLDTLGVKKNEIRSADIALPIIEFGEIVINVIAYALHESRPELTEEVLRKRCSYPELKGLVDSWFELISVSGFGMGEAEAASPGTGTSTDSPPNSEPEGFVTATHTPSNEPSP